MKVLILCAVVFCFLTDALAKELDPMILTTSGFVKGVRKTFLDAAVDVYLGVRIRIV